MEEGLDTGLRGLIAKQEIRDRLMLLFRGLDRRDRELILQAFHPDGLADQGSVKGTAVEMADRVVNGSPPQMMHFIGNHLAEIEGDRAFSETYFVGIIETSDAEGVSTGFRSGRYLDRWERRDGAWRILLRTLVDDWSRLDRLSQTVPGSAGGHRSVRSADDLLYALRAKALGQA
jgi:hypothetical protein